MYFVVGKSCEIATLHITNWLLCFNYFIVHTKQKLTFSIRKAQLTEPTLSCTHRGSLLLYANLCRYNDEWEHSSDECSNKAREIPRIVSLYSYLHLRGSRSKIINWMLIQADAYKARFLSAFLSETGAHLSSDRLAQRSIPGKWTLFF